MNIKPLLLLLFIATGFSLQEPRTVIIKKKTSQPENLNLIPEKFDFTIKGRVKDQFSGESLPFAEVILHNTTNGTSTNIDGYFTLFNIPTDTSLLEVRYLSYKTKHFRLGPEMNPENLEIRLQEASAELQEILVVAEKEDQLIKASTGLSCRSFIWLF